MNSQSQLDLDQVARKLSRLRHGWSERGITAGQLTWRDARACWPKPIVTDRSTVTETESVGITLTAANGEALLVLWRGGWADVDLLLGSDVVSRNPDLHDVAGCVALADSVADQLTVNAIIGTRKGNLGYVAYQAEPIRRTSGARQMQRYPVHRMRHARTTSRSASTARPSPL